MDGIHMIVTCSLHDNSNVIKSHALLDCGATAYAFIDEDFSRRDNFPLYCLHTPRTLHVIDGRPSSSGAITHITKACLRIREHQEDIPMLVTKLGQYPIVLGIPCLRRHDVRLHCATNKVTFSSKYCSKNTASSNRSLYFVPYQSHHRSRSTSAKNQTCILDI